MSIPDRRARLDRGHAKLSVRRQCQLLGLARSGVYRQRQPANDNDLGVMRRLDGLFTRRPFLGSRRLARMLRDMVINRPNQVWAADITYLPMARGFLYLIAIIDWASRAVLAWRLSNSMDVSFCLEALDEALARFGRPEVFNTDQGSQFTSAAFTGRLATAEIRISMDGRGRWLDNVFVERLWRSVRHEEVYLFRGRANAIPGQSESLQPWTSAIDPRSRAWRPRRSAKCCLLRSPRCGFPSRGALSNWSVFRPGGQRCALYVRRRRM